MPILNPFAGVARLLVMAAGIGLVGKLARQPPIVSSIAVGLTAGPSALDAVRSDAQIDLLCELGIAVLLLLVGIKLDVQLIRSLGVVSVMTGLGQIIRTLIQLARSAGFSGRIAAASHSSGDSEALFREGVDLVLEPFQDAADRTVELLLGAVTNDRTDFPPITADGRAPG